MSAGESLVTGPLRVGLIGCGDISSVHLDAITANENAVLVGVADSDQQAATSVAERHRVPSYPDLTRLLEASHPEVVHVCTPHYLHAPMAIECVRRGVSVLLEKPVATTVAEGEAVVRAATAASATIGVCFQNRYNTTVRAIRELLDSGELGRLLGGRAAVNWFRDESYYQRRPWRGRWAEGGGGVLINQAIHTLDLLQWFLGDVTEVHGVATRLSLADSIEVEDTAALQLRHAGGQRSLFYATNGYVADSPITLELVAERGIVKLDTDLRIEHADGRVDTIQETRLGHGEKAYWGASHEDLIDDFYRSVRAGTPFWIGPAEALKTLRIVTSAYDQSAAHLGRPEPA